MSHNNKRYAVTCEYEFCGKRILREEDGSSRYHHYCNHGHKAEAESLRLYDRERLNGGVPRCRLCSIRVGPGFIELELDARGLCANCQKPPLARIAAVGVIRALYPMPHFTE